MQTTAIETVANSLPKNKVILLTLLISKRYIPYTDLRKITCFYAVALKNKLLLLIILSYSDNIYDMQRLCGKRMDEKKRPQAVLMRNWCTASISTDTRQSPDYQQKEFLPHSHKMRNLFS